MDPQPHVRVHNLGVVPVYITNVDLVSGGKRYPFVTVISHQCLAAGPGMASPTVWQTAGAPTYPDPLERGNACNFVLATKGLPAATGGEYIAVSSHAGEIFRRAGQQVTDFLATVTTPAAQRS
jgi:hypothetical protein